MGAKKVDKNLVPQYLKIIRELKSKHVEIGVLGSKGSFMVKIAYVHEYGMTITPKSGRNLSIPLSPKAKGKSPRDFNDLFFVPSGEEKGVGYLARNKGKDSFEILFALMKSVNIPERSYIRSSFDANKSRIDAYANKLLFQVMDFKMTPTQFYEKLGVYCTSLIRKYMTDLKEPSKSPMTLAASPGKDNPLIDTSRLRKSITWQVI